MSIKLLQGVIEIRIKCLLITLVLIFLSLPSFAYETTTCSKFAFYHSGQPVTNSSVGEINFKVTLSGSGTVKLVTYYTDCGKLSEIRIKTVNISKDATEYSSSSVSVQASAKEPFVYGIVWDSGLRPLIAYRITPKNYVEAEVRESIDKYDALSDKKIVDFLISLYDSETGGFAVSPSANETPGFEGELEATATIMTALPGMGLMSSNPNTDSDIPDDFLQKLTDFFVSRQSAEDGYFYDPYYGNYMIETKRERSSSKTISFLEMLQVTPRYPTYLDRISTVALFSDSTLPSYFASEDAYINWMASKNWTTNTYTTGNEITNSIDVAIALGYADATSDFILKKQNPKTGLWGVDTVTSDSTNGALKLSDALRKLGTPYPYVEEAIDSIIKYVENETSPENICTIWNPLILICNIRATHNGVFPLNVQTKIDEKISILLEKTYAHLIKMRTNDGGYKYYPNKPSYDSGGADGCIGFDKDGNIEGNYNSTVIGSYLMRNSVYGVAGLTPTGIWHKYKSYFWEEIKKKMETSNAKYIACDNYFEDFENNTSVSELYKSWGFIFQKKEGSHEIISENGNKCLKINALPTEDGKGGNDRFSSNFKIPKGDTYTLKMKFKVDKSSDRPVFNIFFGPRASNLCLLRDSVIGKNGDKMVLMYRTKTGESLSVSNPHFLKDGVEKGVWHTLKVIYSPKGKTDTVTKYYLNDELLTVTNEYYNGGFSERFPVNNIPFIKIEAFDRSCNATLYLDDISVY